MIIFSELTLSAIEAACQAGAMLKEGFSKHFSWSYKEGDHNLVTEYDKKSEDYIVNFLHKKYPSHSFLAEESGESHTRDDAILWIIDPLDGTVNFAHKIPFFCVSIAAADSLGQLMCGVVFNPILNELFVAEKDLGAFLNHQPIHVTTTSALRQGILTTGFPYNVRENPLSCIEHFSSFAKMGLPIRRLGSAALDLAYTACGRFDGFFEVSLQPWDFSAGALLVKEAKGLVTTYDNHPLNVKKASSVVASNGRVHSEMLQVLQRRKF